MVDDVVVELRVSFEFVKSIVFFADRFANDDDDIDEVLAVVALLTGVVAVLAGVVVVDVSAVDAVLCDDRRLRDFSWRVLKSTSTSSSLPLSSATSLPSLTTIKQIVKAQEHAQTSSYFRLQ